MENGKKANVCRRCSAPVKPDGSCIMPRCGGQSHRAESRSTKPAPASTSDKPDLDVRDASDSEHVEAIIEDSLFEDKTPTPDLRVRSAPPASIYRAVMRSRIASATVPNIKKPDDGAVDTFDVWSLEIPRAPSSVPPPA